MDKLTDEQLDALARHAEWGHLEGQDYEIIPTLVAQFRELRADLATCYRLSGADPDGDSDAHLARYAVEEVARLREEADQAEDALDLLRERVVQLEGQRDRLRNGIEKHRNRKAGDRRCDPKPGHEGKYGCLDHDMRLWSLLDAR